MKICFIIPAYYPSVRWGGPIRSVHLLASELVKLGHSVSVYTTTFGLSENISREKIIDGVVVHYFSSWGVRTWRFSFSFISALRKTHKSFDIFHIHLTWDPMCWISGKFFVCHERPFVFSPRGSMDVALVKKKSFFKKMLLYQIILKNIYKHAKLIHFTSNFEKKEFLSFTKLSLPSCVIPNALDVGELNNFFLDEQIFKHFGIMRGKYILYFGRLNWKKGIDYLVHAFSLLCEKEEMEDAQLVIAGPDENTLHSLQNIIRDLNISNRVIFTGLVSGNDRLMLLREARVFALTSYSENFGMAPAEALAVGVPIVISEYVGISDVVSQYGAGSVVSLNEKVIAEALLQTYTNDKIRNNYIIAGKDLVSKEFDPRIIARRIEQVYQ
ncbi:MAG: glycosyltransferase [Candidatus Paceibacterota bacterium]|jgi:glycosyltransferase involved in cell wall biosynthesis